MDEKSQSKPLKFGRVKPRLKLPWVWDVLLVGILLIGAFFRFTGIKWDGPYHLHPDERFLTMVETSITPIENLQQYFDTATSTLNPNNRGYTFYVYGTFPIFIVRYVAQWIGQTGYDQINVVGRVLSGIFDLGTLVFIYLIGKRLYRNPRLGLLAALFSALAVLQIQLSHYFTVDNFANFFTYAAIYIAICIFTVENNHLEIKSEAKPSSLPAWMTDNWSTFIFYGLFGIFFGMGLASKVSIWALALALPLAAFTYYKKLTDDQKNSAIPILIRNLVLAGIIAFFTFRICQPYAFLGPGFLGLKLNPNWLANLRELSNLSKGDVDVPYALQWARRPITFSLENMVRWGLGIPLGVLSFGGLIWMGWRILKGDWQKHLLIFSWTVFIFVTQSMNWVRSMRYQLPIYPALALIAAWAIFKLWESEKVTVRKLAALNINWKRILAVVIGVGVVLSTGLWAFAFSNIYTQPVTRVTASEWIYRNVSGAINFQVNPQEGTEFMQPAAFQNSSLISSDQPYVYGFSVEEAGFISAVKIEHVLTQQPTPDVISLLVTVQEPGKNGPTYKAAGFLQSSFVPSSDPRGDFATIEFQVPFKLEQNRYYQLFIEVAEPGKFVRIDGAVSIEYEDGFATSRQYLPPPVFRLTSSSPYQVVFKPIESGTMTQFNLNRVVDLVGSGNQSTLTASLVDANQPDQLLATGVLRDVFLREKDPRGEPKWIQFDKPVTLDKTSSYILQLSVAGDGELGIYNDVPVIESTWDDPLPLGMYGFNQFGYYDGLYGNIRNLEMYWDDSATKLDRFLLTLDQSDAIFISSNRQWGTVVRVPERYPLTIEYYRALIGCPTDQDLIWCYSVAEPEMFTGSLGFELTAVFQSDPVIGEFRINDQFAEEAFTVYDHPKVLIFQKTDNYDPEAVRQILGSVDLTKVVHKTPRQASNFSGNLKLNYEQLAVQQSGGTWSEIFPSDSILNQEPWMAAVAWYLAVLLLGWIVYPMVRFVLRGLTDKGYPFSRLTGLLLLAYFTWLAGSLGGRFNRLTIILVIAGLILANLVFAYLQRKELLKEFRTRKKYFLMVELIMLAFFMVDLGIRIGNPDLWHPWKGGEKPMDLSYFTAVLKSSTFPPYDPWYAGGYINYYYYGFVITGVLVKLLGIIPDIAYNLILPTLFGLSGIGVFSIGWNLMAHKDPSVLDNASTETAAMIKTFNRRNLFTGLSAALAVMVLGNLGTIRMFWQGLQRLASPDGLIDNATLFERIGWFISGIGKFLSGAKLPYGFGDWYWIPSRAIPGDVITEFPFFTFTYADLHAHMIALPITLLVIGWSLSMLFRRWKWNLGSMKTSLPGVILTIIFGAFAIGTLRPTNTWDLPTFLALAAVVVFYSAYRYAELPEKFFKGSPTWVRRFSYAAIFVVFLVVMAIVFYLPFVNKYGQAYGTIDTWKGEHTPFWSYLVHWGLPLFLIGSWFAWETREWLAETPVSVLKNFKAYFGYIQVVSILFILILVLLTVLGIKVGWIIGIMAMWALILLMRPKQTDAKRIVLFMIGTALLLTLFVELFVLRGDIGRLNTVFKFYYQAWTLLGICAAVALVWLVPAITTRWRDGYSNSWQVVFALLLFGAALFPVTAAADKIRDRMQKDAPIGLDGTAFMQTATYYDQGIEMELNQDYQAIMWMRENVQGSPVLVETNTVEYRWGNRFTIYTGLPGVLGWNWHERQQRGFVDYNGITDRLNEIPLFYQSTKVADDVKFLDKYHVKYIILGQMERAYYPGEGLSKFEQYDGIYWKEVFREKDTVIYEVMP